MKRFIASVMALVLALSIVPWATAETQSGGKGWTVMVYMVGSDLETLNGYASSDLDEMLAALRPDTNLILLTGGTYRWKNLPDAEGSELYVAKDGALALEERLDRGMGSEYTLRALLRKGFETADGGPTALIFWDHGFGPIEGFGYDELDPKDTILTLTEICSALDVFRENKLSLIGFDACMMAGCETAYLLSPYADYLVASQDTEPPEGWDYSFLRELSPDADAREFGRMAMEAYNSYYTGQYSQHPEQKQPYALSLIDLSGMDALSEAVDALFAELGGLIDEGKLAYISGKRTDSWGFGRTMLKSEYDIVDLNELANALTESTESARRVLEALDRCVAGVSTGGSAEGENAHAKGLSLFFPCYAEETLLAEWQISLSQLPLPENWKSFMMRYPSAIASAGSVGGTVKVNRDGNVYSVELTEEELRLFDRLKCFVYEGLPEMGLRYLYAASDFSLEGNTASIGYDRQCFLITNGEETLLLPAMLTQSDEKTQYYAAYAGADTLNTEDWSAHSYYLRLKLEQDRSSGEVRMFSTFEYLPADRVLGSSQRLDTGKQTNAGLDTIHDFVVSSVFYLPPKEDALFTAFYQWPSVGYGMESLLVGHLDENPDTSDALPLTVRVGTLPETEYAYYIQLVLVDKFNYERASALIPLD